MISEAGVDHQVVGLVYVAARAPDVGEDHSVLAKGFPTPPANIGLVYEDRFGGLPNRRSSMTSLTAWALLKARIPYAVQGRVSDTLFG